MKDIDFLLFAVGHHTSKAMRHTTTASFYSRFCFDLPRGRGNAYICRTIDCGHSSAAYIVQYLGHRVAHPPTPALQSLRSECATRPPLQLNYHQRVVLLQNILLDGPRKKTQCSRNGYIPASKHSRVALRLMIPHRSVLTRSTWPVIHRLNHCL
jgi:hypothetical protein